MGWRRHQMAYMQKLKRELKVTTMRKMAEADLSNALYTLRTQANAEYLTELYQYFVQAYNEGRYPTHPEEAIARKLAELVRQEEIISRVQAELPGLIAAEKKRLAKEAKK